jgi:hypothetical protein
MSPGVGVFAEEPGAVPIVEPLLVASARLDGIPRLGLLNQGLGLAVLHPLQEKLLAPFRNFFLFDHDSGFEDSHQAIGRTRFFKASKTVR